jgi:hypothetical protein
MPGDACEQLAQVCFGSDSVHLFILADFHLQGIDPARPTTKRPLSKNKSGLFQFNPGDDLRSHTVTHAVSSALRGLTSVFGMGTGVTLAV